MGKAVVSVKGRDKGKLYLIVKEIDNYFLLISDGRKKPVESPKRKNRIHLELIEVKGIPNEIYPEDISNDEIVNLLNCHYKEVRLPNVKK